MHNGLGRVVMPGVLFLSDIQVQGYRKLMPEWGATSVWMREVETADLTRIVITESSGNENLTLTGIPYCKKSNNNTQLLPLVQTHGMHHFI